MSSASSAASIPQGDGYVVALRGGEVLLASRQAVLDVLRMAQQSHELDGRAGFAPVARRVALIRTLTASLARLDAAAQPIPAPVSAAVSVAVPQRGVVGASVSDDLIDVPQASAVLHLSQRQVVNLAAGLGGFKAGRRWLLPRAVVVDLARERGVFENSTADVVARQTGGDAA